ncbi:MAG: cell division protein FtsQ [Azospira oryzae]|uniref:Cell division protein FtsQ n=1 Tax=Pelomicrobium methylotrophicum TaxID=2602750 RepID=A0A5C7ENS4_9PROT|nr:cell division protein FtsQ/DivIB [Pelomicrobium methylotrophicum]PZP61520.1 MAG: cell division protein FtsQ [Azospira oryzae]PZP81148.1 MAG: cell division protein FtsQ [Azospira oryzae]TXF13169.1 FtsQ-type POTRA domain-containing protein [Pelomicrobium methylotrophicum]
MWDNPRALNAVANLLFAAGLGALLMVAVVAVAHLPAFALRTVELTAPLERVTAEQVRAVVAREVRGTFFTVDLERVRSGFEKLPWVRKANLTRRWPATLVVELEEHVALARWGEDALINRYGERFKAAFDGRLPVLAGPDGSEHEMIERYLRFRDLLARVGLGLGELRLSDRGAWELKLDQGTVVKLGREHVEQRLARFLAAYGESVGRLGVSVEYVDLRYSHGFAVRVSRTVRETLAPKGT